MGCGGSSGRNLTDDAHNAPPERLSDADLAQQLEGLCATCEQRKATSGHTLCPVCYEAHRRERTPSMCIICGTAPPNDGYMWCQGCYLTQVAVSRQIEQLQPPPQEASAMSLTALPDSDVPFRVSMLPVRNYRGPADALQGDDAECAICTMRYEENEQLLMMPACAHCFHYTCVAPWLERKATCPTCQRDVQADMLRLVEA